MAGRRRSKGYPEPRRPAPRLAPADQLLLRPLEPETDEEARDEPAARRLSHDVFSSRPASSAILAISDGVQVSRPRS